MALFYAMSCDAVRVTDWARQRRWVAWCDAMVVGVSCRYLFLNNNQLSGSIPATLIALR